MFVEHPESILQDLSDLSVAHLPVDVPILLGTKVLVVVCLQLDELQDPEECVSIAIHSDLDAFSVFDVLNDMREVRYGFLILFEPVSLEQYILKFVLLALFELYLHVAEVKIGWLGQGLTGSGSLARLRLVDGLVVLFFGLRICRWNHLIGTHAFQLSTRGRLVELMLR